MSLNLIIFTKEKIVFYHKINVIVETFFVWKALFFGLNGFEIHFKKKLPCLRCEFGVVCCCVRVCKLSLLQCFLVVPL